MHSTHNEGKSIAVDRFIRTLQNNFTKNVYMNKLDDIVNKYNNSYHPNKYLSFVLRNSFVFVFRRRLDQDQYIHLGHTPSKRLVFKTL